MINFFYGNEIAEQIQNLLDANLGADVKSIYIGDLSVLPAPDILTDKLPAVVITASNTEVIFANESRNIAYTPYQFSIYAVTPFAFEGENAENSGLTLANAAANVLLNFRTLDGLIIAKADGEIGGEVMFTEVSKIEYETAETELFRALEVPAKIARIDFSVKFRTYKG